MHLNFFIERNFFHVKVFCATRHTTSEILENRNLEYYGKCGSKIKMLRNQRNIIRWASDNQISQEKVFSWMKIYIVLN